jgi:hypothetical protein
MSRLRDGAAPGVTLVAMAVARCLDAEACDAGHERPARSQPPANALAGG